MVTMELEPEVEIIEKPARPEYTTCYECHRVFRAQSESEFCPELCDSCLDALRHLREPVVSVRMKAPETRIWL